MLFSKYFIHTLRDDPKDAEVISHKLSLRACLLQPLAAGVFSYLPLGLRVLRNVEKVIRKHMDSLGAQEVLLPALQPLSLWKKTSRDDVLGRTMIRFKDRRGRDLVLGPTHEEVITYLVSQYVNSYKQLPFVLYQIQAKFRDELRPRFGVIRSCEFIMKDAYSFNRDDSGLDDVYNRMHGAYLSIFKECGIDVVGISADAGFIGGSASAEFLSPSEAGEDILYYCDGCGKNYRDNHCSACGNSSLKQTRNMEVGHIFKLGTKYSHPLKAVFSDESGKITPISMGCYGIGVSRLIAAIIEGNSDKKGIVWPRGISPFDIEIIPLSLEDEELKKYSFLLYEKLKRMGFEVLIDDRQQTAGVKFNDAALLGIPYSIVIGKKSFANNKVEVNERESSRKITLDKDNVLSWADGIRGIMEV